MGGKILSKSKSDMLLMTTFVRQAKAVVIWRYGLPNFQERDTKLSKKLSSQKVPKSDFQTQFLILRTIWIFRKIISFYNINIGEHFLINSNFETLYFLNHMPIFWRLGAMSIFKIQQFPLSMFISEQKSIYVCIPQLKNR